MAEQITKLDIREIYEVSIVANPANPVTVIANVPQYLAEKYGLIPKED